GLKVSVDPEVESNTGPGMVDGRTICFLDRSSAIAPSTTPDQDKFLPIAPPNHTIQPDPWIFSGSSDGCLYIALPRPWLRSHSSLYSIGPAPGGRAPLRRPSSRPTGGAGGRPHPGASLTGRSSCSRLHSWRCPRARSPG